MIIFGTHYLAFQIHRHYQLQDCINNVQPHFQLRCVFDSPRKTSRQTRSAIQKQAALDSPGYPKLPTDPNLTYGTPKETTTTQQEESDLEGDTIDLNIEKGEHLSVREFQEQCKLDPTSLYNKLLESQNTLHENARNDSQTISQSNGILYENYLTIKAARDEVNLLRKVLNKATSTTSATAMNQLRQDLDASRAERDRLNLALDNLRITEEVYYAHSSLSTQHKRSVKLPDPPILTDGTSPKFEDWMIAMENKLSANADRFDTPKMRLAYVTTRCGGNAFRNITPPMRKDAMITTQTQMTFLIIFRKCTVIQTVSLRRRENTTLSR